MYPGSNRTRRAFTSRLRTKLALARRLQWNLPCCSYDLLSCEKLYNALGLVLLIDKEKGGRKIGFYIISLVQHAFLAVTQCLFIAYHCTVPPMTCAPTQIGAISDVSCSRKLNKTVDMAHQS